jgi:hypothetical protein
MWKTRPALRSSYDDVSERTLGSGGESFAAVTEILSMPNPFLPGGLAA